MKLRSLCSIASSLACALGVSAAHAGDDNAKALHQTYHDHFASCAHDSKGLRGAEHHQFMSECLKDHGWQQAAHKSEAHKSTAEASPQQHRMQSCNEEARSRNLHGDERRAFMSSCLKG